MLLLLLPLLASGAPSSGPCCTSKTVGGLEYTLVREDSAALSLSCLSPCVYERSGMPGLDGGPQYCFARGEQTVFCGNSTSNVAGVDGLEYLAMSAADKMARIWANSLANQTSANWLSQSEFDEIKLEDMCPVFHATGDEMPISSFTGTTRRKFVHTVGTVGRVEWVNKGGHPFTGIFEGATEGIVRFSVSLKPSPPAPGIKPGMALKFTRDGLDSVNLVAMHNIDGQQSWNIFKNIFTTHIPEISGVFAMFVPQFSTVTNNIRQVGTNDWADYKQDGTKVAAPIFPYRLRFRPTGKIMFSDSYMQDLDEDLKTVPIGSVLYEILALDQPEETGGKEKHIGDLVLRSPMTTSQWGDRHLFFRHEDEANDLAIKPQWSKFTPRIHSASGSDHSKCPFGGKN